jgi:hypothetical protein
MIYFFLALLHSPNKLPKRRPFHPPILAAGLFNVQSLQLFSSLPTKKNGRISK